MTDSARQRAELEEARFWADAVLSQDAQRRGLRGDWKELARDNLRLAEWVEAGFDRVDALEAELANVEATLAVDRKRCKEYARRVEALEQFIRRARPLLGMSIMGSLGRQADELLAAVVPVEEQP